jgi:nitroreductase
VEFQEVVRRRHMVRNFDDRPVAPEVLQRILANATRAPSAGFSQGWGFLVLEGPGETGPFWDASFPPGERQGFAYPGLFRAPVVIVALSHRQAYIDRYAEPDKGGADRDGGRWPVPYWHVDTGFAALLMLLTAVDAGLGALFFSVHRHDAFREAFGVPDEYTPVGAVAVGHPLPHPASPSLARGRRPLGDVVHRGRW